MNRTFLILLLIPFALCGCRSSEGKRSSSDDAVVSALGTQEARRAQNDFGDRFSGTVQTAADEIAAATDDWAVRRRTVIWKMRMIKDVRRALQNPFIADAGVDLWILCVQMRQYLETGEGRTLFGEAQGVAVRAAKRCEDDLVTLARDVVREEHFARVRERIEAYAREHPLKPIFVREAFRSKGETKSGGRNRVSVVSNVLNLPIDVVRAPFQAMGGVGDVAGAVREFSVVAANIGETVDVLPEQARWQIERMVSRGRTAFSTTMNTKRSLAREVGRRPVDPVIPCAMVLPRPPPPHVTRPRGVPIGDHPFRGGFWMP